MTELSPKSALARLQKPTKASASALAFFINKNLRKNFLSGMDFSLAPPFHFHNMYEGESPNYRRRNYHDNTYYSIRLISAR